uniref:Prolyl 4-hydroxylase alpha subunit Fe(2+) 2OG dioxygenase domain-containing protein n=2 Tax=Chrysotila carterae TaxID=13221 RepID=A0A7S4EUS2_CHRCT|mmetsp:Transcript_31837/g.61263  ORF Transcript_31837/g.61263 Transcript_31837/m.61263 type:complete len:253 (+) Transcript_31837:547-1305(+)
MGGVFSSGAGEALLGVPRAGQLACYSITHAQQCGGDGGSGDDGGDGSGAALAGTDSKGARYKAHRDGIGRMCMQALMFPGTYMREVTAVLYIAPELEDWQHRDERMSVPQVVVYRRSVAAADSSPSSLAPSVDESAIPNGCSNAPVSSDPITSVCATSKERGRPGSLILYMGAEWSDDTGETATALVDIQPVGGTLVLFDSRTVLHEVLPHAECAADRVALTIWIGGAYSIRSLLANWRERALRLLQSAVHG